MAIGWRQDDDKIEWGAIRWIYDYDSLDLCDLYDEDKKSGISISSQKSQSGHCFNLPSSHISPKRTLILPETDRRFISIIIKLRILHGCWGYKRGKKDTNNRFLILFHYKRDSRKGMRKLAQIAWKWFFHFCSIESWILYSV